MISLTQQLALEYAEQNIRVLAVNPGTIETSLALESVNHDYVALRQSAADSHPIGRIGRPEEIAAVVLFLSSDAASFMTGEYVNVDGGIMAKGSWAE
jgi:NAD(P)-dependent dehydrogenase (short-subunit alcohol dehydrogenase family)